MSGSGELIVEQPSKDTLRVILSGSWRLGEPLPSTDDFRQKIESLGDIEQITFDAKKLGYWDSGLLTFLRLLRGKAQQRHTNLWLIIEACSGQALPIVTLISFLVGMILAFIGVIQLALFGAEIYVANLVGIAMVRLMAAILTGIFMAGHKLEVSEFNRWAGPLKDSISRVIEVNLSNMLETTRLFKIPRRNKTIPFEFRIEIDIPRFDGKLGGDALLVARRTIYGRDEKALLTKVSIISEPSGGEGYDKLIAAQNRALQELSQEIVDAIKANR